MQATAIALLLGNRGPRFIKAGCLPCCTTRFYVWPQRSCSSGREENCSTGGGGGDTEAHFPTPPPSLASVGPNFSHHKARVQGVGWFPLGTRKQGGRPFAAPTPPNRNGPDRKQAQHTPPPPVCPCTLTAGRHMVIEVPPLTDRERTPNDEYVGIWDSHGNPAGGPPLPNK